VRHAVRGVSLETTTSAGLGFPSKVRLRKRRQFLRVQGTGRRIGGKHFLFFVLRRDDSESSSVAGGARFGITVTRKIGNAVVRNRVKRIVREGCRRTARLFPTDLDLVIVARPSAATAALGEAANELLQLARRLGSESSR
jgi:ribonuclease P protein component